MTNSPRGAVAVGSGTAAAPGVVSGRDGQPTLPPIRAPELDWRIALHESSHCVAARYYNLELGGCTVEPSEHYSGLTWGPKHEAKRAFDNSIDEPPEIVEFARQIMPPLAGEDHAITAAFVVHARSRIIELLSATEGERLLFPSKPPFGAVRDLKEARQFAELICAPEAVDSYLEYARIEAAALIAKSAHCVLAVAEELSKKRTLTGVEIDKIIDGAVVCEVMRIEKQRRADWAATIENAKSFPRITARVI